MKDIYPVIPVLSKW